MKNIEIKAIYSFWRHPLKWMIERKMRKIMEGMVNYAWEHGMKEDVEKASHDLMLYGKAKFTPKDYFKDGR